MKPKLIVATGISGCGRKNYLERWERYAVQRNKKVKIFPVGEMMFEQAAEIGLRLKPENILNVDRDLLDVLRSAVFNKILGEISGESFQNYDAIVLCVHAFFYWQKHYIRAFDKFLGKFSPDLYITFIDSHQNIEGRLASRKQWGGENLSGEKILEWQGVEVEAASGFADISGKPFFAIPAAESSSLFYRLVFHPEIETVYTAMPISHLTDPEDRRAIDEFIEKVAQYFVVFNPLAVEGAGADNLTASHHIAYRDLDWLVRRADKIIILWPKLVSSPGADHETHAAFTKAKDVWTVCLHDPVSPFVTHFSTKFFTSTQDFFVFLEKNYESNRQKI